MTTPVHMEGEFEFFPHAYLHDWACHLIDDARSVPNGSANYYRISSLLVVLSFEAYLNYVGERHFQEWPEKKSWKKKLELILDQFELTLLQDKEPFSLLEKLFCYRNFLAHGRISVNPLNYHEHEDGRVEGDHTGDPEWYKNFGNREQAERTLQAVRDAMLAIHKAADPDDRSPPWTIHGTGQSSEVKE